MCRILLPAVVFLFLAAAPVEAQVKAPLADRVPNDALLYIGWTGSPDAQRMAEGSHAEALLKQSGLAELFERTLPGLGKAMGQRDEKARPWVKVFSDILPIMYDHPTAIAFGGVDYSNPDEPLPRILLICDAGDDAAALRNRLGELFTMVQNVGLFTLMDVQDGVLYLNIGWQKLDLAMVREDPARSLGSDERFTTAMQGMFDQPLLALFLDVPGLARFAEEGARRDKGEQAALDFQKFLEATGLRGLGSITATTGFQDRLYVTRAFVETRGARTGVLGLLDGEALDESLLQNIPADAGLVAAGRFDLAKLLEAVRNAIFVTQPNSAGDFEQGLKFINMLVGADLENDLLKSMGKSWAAYTAPITGDTALGLVAINRPEQPERVQSALKNLSLSIVSLVNTNAQQKGEPFRLASRQVDLPTGSVNYLDLPIVAPAWSGDDQLAWFGLYPQSIASARSLDASAESFAGSDAFESIRRLAGDNAIRGFTYIDLNRYSGQAYTRFNALAQLGSGALSGFGETNNITARFPPMVLPPYATFREHVTPIIGVTWVDERGLHLRYHQPFPFSGLLAIGMQ
jgi:hypothetical protein